MRVDNDLQLKTMVEQIARGSLPWDGAKLDTLLERNAEALRVMRLGTHIPDCDWQESWELGPLTPHEQDFRGQVLAELNVLDGIRLANAGRITEAIEVLKSGIVFSRHLGNGYAMSGVLFAAQDLTLHYSALLHLLGTEKLTDSTLSSLETSLQSEPEYIFDWSRPMKSQLDSQEWIYEHAGDEPDMLNKCCPLLLSSVAPVSPEDFRNAKQEAFRELEQVYGNAADALSLPYLLSKPKIDHIQGGVASLNRLVKPGIPNLVRYNEMRARLEADRAALISVIALRRSYLKNRHYPATLAGMEVPVDPYTGSPLRIIDDGSRLKLLSAGSDLSGNPIAYSMQK